jgi:hypothetical protein
MGGRTSVGYQFNVYMSSVRGGSDVSGAVSNAPNRTEQVGDGRCPRRRAADPVGAVEVGQREDVKQLGAGSRTERVQSFLGVGARPGPLPRCRTLAGDYAGAEREVNRHER